MANGEPQELVTTQQTTDQTFDSLRSTAAFTDKFRNSLWPELGLPLTIDPQSPDKFWTDHAISKPGNENDNPEGPW